MRIQQIEAIPYRLPLRRDCRWASSTVPIGRFVLVRVVTDEDIVGIGEAAPLPDWGGDYGRYSGETQETVCSVINKILAPALTGMNATDINQINIVMARQLKGNHYARAAIDIALYDILGKVANLPLYRLLGGATKNSVPIAHMIGIMPIEEAVEEAEKCVADGVTSFQIKSGLDPRRDIALIMELRRRFGDDLWLRIDANQGYGSPKYAIRTIHALEEHGIDYVEQPVMGLDAMAVVKCNVRVPIIADESCWTARDAYEAIRCEAVDAISIYLAKAGGITGALRVAAVAESANVPCDVNGSLESGIGNAANVHFALATAVVRLPCVIPISARTGEHPYQVAGVYYEDDIITESFRAEGGTILPLERPGLGVDVDEEKLRQFGEH